MSPGHDRMMDLLVILLEVLAADPESSRSRAAMVQDRAEAVGLGADDVHGLLMWLENHVVASDEPAWITDESPDAPSEWAFHYFGVESERYLTAGGMGYLLALLNTHQITRSQMEALLWYAARVAFRPMDGFDLEPIIEQVLFAVKYPGMTGGASEGIENIH